MFVLIREKSGTPVGIFRDKQNAYKFVENFHKDCTAVVDNNGSYITIQMVLATDDVDQWVTCGRYRLHEVSQKD